MIEVVAALIWQDEKLLICKRLKHKPLPLLWEFPGGKIEKGETFVEALKREIQEELDVEIETRDIFHETTHHYEDFSVKLIFINATIIKGNVKNLEHEEIQWINKMDIDKYEFCPADLDVIEKIKNS